jgi:hypothetical protein
MDFGERDVILGFRCSVFGIQFSVFGKSRRQGGCAGRLKPDRSAGSFCSVHLGEPGVSASQMPIAAKNQCSLLS